MQSILLHKEAPSPGPKGSSASVNRASAVGHRPQPFRLYWHQSLSHRVYCQQASSSVTTPKRLGSFSSANVTCVAKVWSSSLLSMQQVAQHRESDVLTPSRVGLSRSLRAAAAAPPPPPRRELLPPRPERRLPCGRRVRSVRGSALCRRGYAGHRRSGCGGLSPDRASAVPLLKI